MIFATAALLATGASANAVSISLIYLGANNLDDDGAIPAQAGDVLEFDLVMDFTSRPTIGGGFDVSWDTANFDFNGFTSAGLGNPDFFREPVVMDGLLFNGGVGDFNGIFQGVIATLSLTYFGGEGSMTPSATTGTSGPWIDAIDFLSTIEPDYFGVNVRPVPIPAALWLLLSGLGIFAGLARKKTRWRRTPGRAASLAVRSARAVLLVPRWRAAHWPPHSSVAVRCCSSQ
ncbi:MAG: VPLPA-CTERM sorting domain-containing protein [Gammaproteobacteria bacterium]